MNGQHALMRIFIGESDRAAGRPLHTVIVETLRRRGVAGATVLKGVEGFGKHSTLHTAHILRLSQDLPLVIESVDEEAKLRAALSEIEPLLAGALVTFEKVEVVHYSAPVKGG